ncbi:MAG: hypothetical protein C5B53_03215 [Candidatus Melainabacteria bacterium]|nr:MAG: hypothetical protein C5B53_03215 [Candidatus Melainabacteria bacterium]
MNTRRAIATTCASARLFALSILFGGSSAIVFAAITFVKTARAQGMTVAEAARYNAPTFIAYSKIALVLAAVLALAELTEYFLSQVRPTVSQAIRYGAELACIAATLVFGVVIVPAMDKLLPELTRSALAYDAFHKLHHWSEVYFGCMILFALISLVAPAFKKE